jgi:alkylation response protein AidB-like acyl-CoA dehydrogenase
MDFDFTAEQDAFRSKVRDWLTSALPPGWGETVHEPLNEAERAIFKRDWDRKMYRGGWAGIAWPRDYGGRGATLVEQAIFLEELARARAPEGLNIVGRNLAGPTLIRHGTAAQKERFLRPILSGEEVWCQGFSEPNSGSDLASIRCRAELRGDRFVVNGQKVWTSFAQYAQWCFLLCRTDPTAPKHKGISFLLVDMTTPGITIRPLVQINGDTEFSEVFFDNVEVPRENLVGAMNSGWSIAMTTLTFERGPEEALYRQVKFKYDLDRLIDYARRTTRNGAPIAADPVARQKIAAAAMEVELLRLNILRAFSKVLNGKELGPEASFTKLYWSHMWTRLAELAVELQGPSAPLMADDPAGLLGGTAQFNLLTSKASTIYSGTSEVQRNIIGERVLGLPKEPVAA